MKKILMACTNYWSSPFQVGSNQLAQKFSENDWQIAWLSDPITPLHLVGGRYESLRERFNIYKQGGKHDLHGNLWYYVPGSLFAPNNKPILRSEWVHNHWQSTTFPNVKNIVAKKGFLNVDILYLNSNSQPFWLDMLHWKSAVLRIADKNSAFARQTARMAAIEREMSQRVNLVFYTAKTLESYIHELKPQSTLYLPNGVNFKHFDLSRDEVTEPIEYRNIGKPIVVYVGSFDEWQFDFELIRMVALEMKDLSFILIGPDYLQKAQNTLSNISNVHLLGPRPYAVLPAYLIHANVGIIPFPVVDLPELMDYVNPIKLYEYLAAGLPVVATETRELVQINSPAVLARSADEFAAAIRAAVETPPEQKALKEYAQAQDWSERFNLLLSAIPG